MPRKRNAAEAEADPEMKLFGRKIPVRDDKKSGQALQIVSSNDQDLHPSQEDTPTSVLDDFGSSSAGSCEEEKPEKEGRASDAVNPGNSSPNAADSDAVHQQQPAVIPAQEADQERQDKPEAAAVEAAPKRPDKPVPCPRCNSMDTKFCYFNNYNVNQPRHFCKNCQRYWTAGGTLRNVPVGAGRRKSKHGSGNSSSHSWHHHHQEQLKVAQQQQPKVAASQSGSRLRLPPPPELCHFSTPDTSPSSSSMITSLNSSPVSMSSNMFSMQMAKAAAAAAAPGGEASSSPVVKSSSVSSNKNWSSSQNNKTSSSSQKHSSVVVIDEDKSQDCRNCSKPPPAAAEKSSGDCNGCAAAGGLSNLFNGGPSFWPYNFASWYGSGVAASTPESQQQMQADMAAWLSSVWASGVPAWAPLAWNMPWAFAAAFAAAASNGSGFVPPPPPPPLVPPPPPPPPQLYPKTLGKHAREGGRVEGCLWAPKTLRIEDPGEVAKSSFWTTLGLDKASSKSVAATPARASEPEDKPQVRARPAAAVQENK